MKRLIVLLIFMAAPALADSRIREVYFDPDTVALVTGTIGVQTMIEFENDEHIENIAVGDSAAWQVTPNRRANVIFVKPLVPNAATNMSVITEKRRYLFELRVSGAGQRAVYTVRFTYPLPPPTPEQVAASESAAAAANEPASATQPPLPINERWTYRGARQLRPTRIYDDSVSTYLEWPANIELPTILTTGADGAEGPVNFEVRGNLLVIEGVGPRYIIRFGRAEGRIDNAAPAGGASSTPSGSGS